MQNSTQQKGKKRNKEGQESQEVQVAAARKKIAKVE